jgi:2-polyprenyl-3-methyl-5-hydroxy-6-metoxy-1,4-benzoquinol methylase
MNRVQYITSRLNGKILDVGYYACTLHGEILRTAGKENVFGVDTELKKETPNYKKASAEKIPFQTQSFDTIIAGELIEHLKKPELFIKEANRLLKKDGKLIITTPNKESLLNKIFHNNETKIHLSLFSYSELENLLKKNNFEVIDFSPMPYTFESSEGSSNKWSFLPRKLISIFLPKKLQEEIVLTARKIR